MKHLRILFLLALMSLSPAKAISQNPPTTQRTANPWLAFTTNAGELCPGESKTTDAACNTFERGAPIRLKFRLVDKAPAGTKSFDYRVNDYFENTVAAGSFPIAPGKKQYVAKFTPPGPGYYEVRAFSTNDKGDAEQHSCIKTRGSFPKGLGTFAVMPGTIKENVAAMKKVGESAFFGIMGIRTKWRVNELMGFPWRMGSSRWRSSKKPDRSSDAFKEQRKKLLETYGRRPVFDFSTQAFMPNIAIPTWAKQSLDRAPGFDWNDYAPYVRDIVESYIHRYPHMKRRVYEPSWEVDANRHPYGRKPYYSPQDVVDVYKRTRAIIKEMDPDAVVTGPTAFFQSGWFEDVFKAGLLEHLDAIALHQYIHPPPESAGVVQILATLRNLMRKYGRRELPIYNTEAGFQSLRGSSHRIREHARWNARYALILKGEGVQTHLAFFIVDFAPYDGIRGNNTWGLCFNPIGAVHPDHASPKAALPALATCSYMLLGSKPVRHLRWWGKDVWGYVFEKNDRPILVVWQPYAKQHLRVPVGNIERVALTDVMGRRTSAKATNGFVDLEIGPDPIYITGADPALYRDRESPTTTLYPGRTQHLTVADKDAGPIANVASWGDVNAKKHDSDKTRITVSLSDAARPGPVPIMVSAKNGNIVKWIVVGQSVEIKNVRPDVRNGVFGVTTTLVNHAERPLSATASLRTQVDRTPKRKEVRLETRRDANVFLPVRRAGKRIDPAQPIQVELLVTWNDNRRTTYQDRIYTLSAFRQPDRKDPVFSNRVAVTGAGSSGQRDSADVRFAWDEQHLLIHVDSHDDVFHQRTSGETTWLHDSIQLAFDTHPESALLYDFRAGRLKKKITELTLAHTANGNQVWRHRTHNSNELPQGDVTGSGITLQWKRNEPEKRTTYVINVPWKQIGLTKVRQGKAIGISILINDSDGPDAPRKGLELFSGIMNAKDHRLFGRIVLR